MRKTTLILELAILFTLTVPSSGQVAPAVHQTATNSTCVNIVALSGAKVDCSRLTQEQSKALANIPAIMKMALEDHNYLELILKRLEAMSVEQKPLIQQGGQGDCQANAIGGIATVGNNCGKPNPNVGSTSYQCTGWAVHSYSGNGGAMNLDSDPTLTKNYGDMMKLGRDTKWSELNTSCKKEIAAHPDWLTPYLLCADTEYRLGNLDSAKKYFDTFESLKGYAYRDAPCPNIEDNVRRELTMPQ